MKIYANSRVRPAPLAKRVSVPMVARLVSDTTTRMARVLSAISWGIGGIVGVHIVLGVVDTISEIVLLGGAEGLKETLSESPLDALLATLQILTSLVLAPAAQLLPPIIVSSEAGALLDAARQFAHAQHWHAMSKLRSPAAGKPETAPAHNPALKQSSFLDSEMGGGSAASIAWTREDVALLTLRYHLQELASGSAGASLNMSLGGVVITGSRVLQLLTIVYSAYGVLASLVE